MAEWPVRPRTTTRTHSSPPSAVTIARAVGSSTIAASATWPRASAARVPGPPVSSSTTDWNTTSPREAHAERLQGSQGDDAAGDAALHVAGAPPPQATAFELAAPRIVRPRRRVACRDDVDVPVENQRAPAARAGQPAHDVVATGQRLEAVELACRARRARRKSHPGRLPRQRSPAPARPPPPAAWDSHSDARRGRARARSTRRGGRPRRRARIRYRPWPAIVAGTADVREICR